MAYGRTSGWSPSPPYGAWWGAPYGPGEAGGGVMKVLRIRADAVLLSWGGVDRARVSSAHQTALEFCAQVGGEDGAGSVHEQRHLVADEADVALGVRQNAQ